MLGAGLRPRPEQDRRSPAPNVGRGSPDPAPSRTEGLQHAHTAQGSYGGRPRALTHFALLPAEIQVRWPPALDHRFQLTRLRFGLDREVPRGLVTKHFEL